MELNIRCLFLVTEGLGKLESGILKGLKITAGQRTMTGQNDKISAVFLIGHVRDFQIIN